MENERGAGTKSAVVAVVTAVAISFLSASFAQAQTYDTALKGAKTYLLDIKNRSNGFCSVLDQEIRSIWKVLMLQTGLRPHQDPVASDIVIIMDLFSYDTGQSCLVHLSSTGLDIIGQSKVSFNGKLKQASIPLWMADQTSVLSHTQYRQLLQKQIEAQVNRFALDFIKDNKRQ